MFSRKVIIEVLMKRKYKLETSEMESLFWEKNVKKNDGPNNQSVELDSSTAQEDWSSLTAMDDGMEEIWLVQRTGNLTNLEEAL